MRRAAKAALSVITSTAENDSPISDLFFVDLHEKRDKKCSAKATLGRIVSEIEDENASEEAAAHCVPVE